jgi:hypothetical protein
MKDLLFTKQQRIPASVSRSELHYGSVNQPSVLW